MNDADERRGDGAGVAAGERVVGDRGGVRVSDPRGWLRAREPAPPAALLQRMEQALAERDGAADSMPARAAGAASAERAGIAEALAGAALDRLRAALASPNDRAAAPDLLTADALLTYACEAAAEQGPEALAALAEACGPDRLALLAEAP